MAVFDSISGRRHNHLRDWLSCLCDSLMSVALISRPALSRAFFIVRGKSSRSLQGEVLLALGNPQVRERIAALGLEPVGSTPAEFRVFVQAEIKKYAEMVRAAGIQPE